MAGNSKAIQVRIATATVDQVGGQRAHDLRLGAQPEYIDADRSSLNRVLVEPARGVELRKVCVARRDRRSPRRTIRRDAAIAMNGIITFGHDAQTVFGKLGPDRQDAAYRAVAEAVAARLQTSVSGLVVHEDETAPHAHFQFPGVTHDGHPVSRVARLEAVRDLQTIAARVAAEHAPGIERGTPKALRLAAGENYADVVNRSVKELHHDLPAELDALRGQIAAAEAKRAQNEDRAEKARAKAERAEADAEKAAKALKRAETYERRAETARAEVERLEGRLANLKARETAVSAREAAVAEKEAELQRREARMAQEAEWTARAMGNLGAAIGQAMTGRHGEEIAAEDMADSPEKFATLRKAAPEGRVTWGFRAEFWSLAYSVSGTPAPLPQKVREASEKAFGKVATFAKKRLNLLAETKREAQHDVEAKARIAAEAAKSAAESLLASARSKAAKIERSALETRREAESAAKDHLDAAEREAARVLKEAYERANNEFTPDRGLQAYASLFELLKGKIHETLGETAYQRLRTVVNAEWRTHPDNINREVEVRRPTYGAGPSGP